MQDLMPLAKNDYCYSWQKATLAYFEQHRAKQISDGHWIFAASKTAVHFCDIVLLSNKRIFVGGDTEDCIFGYGPCMNVLGLARWIGESKDYRYIWEKARIGMNAELNIISSFESRVALYVVNPVVHYAIDAAKRAPLAELKACIQSGESERTILELAAKIDPEWAAHLGRVPSHRVFTGWSALIKFIHHIDLNGEAVKRNGKDSI